MSFAFWQRSIPVRALIACCLASAVAVPGSARASTVRYRTDAELIALSERVVHARVLRQRTARPAGPDGAIYTVTTLAVLEDLTGVAGDEIEAWELGGAFGDELMFVGGGVDYTVGAEVLVCLDRGRFGLRSVAMGFSKFDVRAVVGPAGDTDGVLTRDVRDTVVMGGAVQGRERSLAQFRALSAQVRRVGSRRNPAAEGLQAEPGVQANFTVLTFSNGLGPRWLEADSAIPVRWWKNTSAPPPLSSGDAVSEIQTALAAWTTPGSASIILQYGGTTNQSVPEGPWSGIGNGNGVITFEDPYNELSGSTLAIGGGFASFGDGGIVNGTTFNRYTRGYVIFQNAANLSSTFTQSLGFTRVLEHEIGHGIGFGHTQTDGSVANPESNIMYPSCCSPVTPVPPAIGPDDLAGLNFIYPSGATGTCTFSLSPSSATATAGGGTGSVTVTAGSGCSWTASSNVSFVTFTSGASGTGNGTVAYSVAATSSQAPRTATLTIAGQTFTITQAAGVVPAITAQPSNQSVIVGQNAQFTATATGTPSPTLQWQVSTNAGVAWTALTNAAPYSGAIAATLTITGATAGLNDARYRLVATNSAGSATSNAATLAVAGAPTIGTHPSSQSVPAGQNAQFTVAASGTPAPTYQWQASTNAGVSWTTLTNAAPYSGATTTTLTVTSVSLALNDARYRSVATNSAGSVTSNPATLTIDGAPGITAQPSSQSIVVGQNAQFTVAASGTPAPAYQWQVSINAGVSWTTLSSAAPYSGVATATLTVTSPTVALSGNQYRAIATNTASSATSNAATLTVRLPAMALDKTLLLFSAVRSGVSFIAQTGSQTLRLTQSGTGTVSWTATSNNPWITVSPASGTGAATLTVGVAFSNTLPTSGTVTGAVALAFTGAGNAAASVSVGLTLSPGSAAPFGVMDTPLDGVTGVTGSLPVTGWALDDVEVGQVRVVRDPIAGEGTAQIFIGYATFVDGSRPDVAAGNPTLPRNTRAGWGYLLLTNFLPNQGNGTFRLSAYADDADGHSSALGSRTITCTNSSATLPFGALDTPGQGETISGTSYNNFGWVLARGPDRADPPSGGTVRVLIDGVFGPSPTGWVSRPDLTALFPAATYPGITNAGGAYTFDTTTLADGMHTIAWVVTSNTGLTDGIGSRFFTVANGLTGSVRLQPDQFGSAGLQAGQTGLPPDLLRLRDEVNGAALDRSAIAGRRGHDSAAPLRALNADSGQALLQGEELDRFELQLGEAGLKAGTTDMAGLKAGTTDMAGLKAGTTDMAGLKAGTTDMAGLKAGTTGYMRVGHDLGPLPIGSRLDPATGEFTWQAGVGFVGTYDLVFVRCAGSPEGLRYESVAQGFSPAECVRQEVRIVLNPKSSGRVGPQVVIDLPAPASAVASGLSSVASGFSRTSPVVSGFSRTSSAVTEASRTVDLPQPFVVAGWAIDLDSDIGTGVDTLHVWAYPSSGADPMFLGVTAYGGARPDVAAIFGDRYKDSGYGIIVQGLEPGDYNLAVFAWSTVTGGFVPAKTVRVTVR